jgi:hypothetical protein
LIRPSSLANIENVTIELARRLFHGGVVAADDLEAALFDTVVEGTAFPAALARRSSVGTDLVDRELERVAGIGVSPVLPDRGLLDLLPEGLCDRLLAVPLGRDPTTDEVTVAAVDALDPHVSEEFGYHLESPVVVLPASRGSVAAALREPAEPSEPPPATLAYAEEHVTRPGVAPPAPIQMAIPGQIRPASSDSRGSESEPPIPLVRRSVLPHGGGSASSSIGAEASGSRELPAMESVLEALEWAAQPDEVVDQLIEGFGTLALHVAVFAEQGGVHRGRAASPSLGGAAAARAAAQPSSPECVLDQAVARGSYLGPLEPLGRNAVIHHLVGGSVGEVYAVPVIVSGRPALVLLLASLQATALATRRADELARAGGAALERIVLARKGR